jgi:hypothetical protein
MDMRRRMIVEVDADAEPTGTQQRRHEQVLSQAASVHNDAR